MMEVVVKLIGNYSYQTSRCLGEGVYGKVYEGVQRQTKQKVAIKKIDLNTFTNDKYLENAIFSQIYLLKRFNHPNIVRFKDVLSSKNSLYIITEFCKNGDLKELIKRKRFKEDEAFQIMRQLLSGFSELVREKIIHRDLKPANILISDGVYKIGDFGFAKYVDNFGSQMLRSCVGSPIYMAPQILQRTQYTTKCDIWSLGIIFYEMIHGYPPWKARDETELLRSIKNNPITQLLKKSNLSSESNQFLKRCLAFSQEQRISWNQLFQTFGGGRMQKSQDTHSEHKSANKEKQRVNSTHSHSTTNNLSSGMNSNQSSNIDQAHQWKPQLKSHTSLTPHQSHQSHMSSSPVIPHQSSPHHNTYPTTPQSLKQNYNSNTHINTYSSPSINLNTNTNTNAHQHSNLHMHRNDSFDPPSSVSSGNSTSKKQAYLDGINQWRQFLIYYHFFTLEMFTNFSYIQGLLGKSEMFSKLLFSIASLVKNRSTYCLSMIVMQSKTSKTVQQLYKKMQNEHEMYELTYNDIQSALERNGHYKAIRSEYNSIIGHNEIISEQRMDKMENFMVSAATENCQVMCEEVKKKLKGITSRDYPLVQALDNVLDVMRLSLGKGKFLKEVKDEEREQVEDIKEFVAKVFGKVDRLFANL